MRLQDIICKIENLAPTYLKEGFDNVGLMVGDRNQEVKKILLALDCTNEVIEEGKNLGVDLIITHHPLIFRKPSSITRDDLLGNKVIELIKNDISLYSAHTNLDSAKGGINEKIVKILGFTDSKIIEKNHSNEEAGLGRLICLQEEKSLDEIIELVKNRLNILALRVVKGSEKVKKIAVINGSGQDFFGRAKSLGADCIITGDTTYHFASDYMEMGISIIDAGHFNTEWIIFLNTLEEIMNSLSDVEIFISKKSKDPYIFC